MNYKSTILWNNSLGNVSYGNDDLRLKLKEAYFCARENAAYVLEKIRKDFSNLTVHDITHVDGLWRVGSVIVGENYEINPLERIISISQYLLEVVKHMI